MNLSFCPQPRATRLSTSLNRALNLDRPTSQSLLMRQSECAILRTPSWVLKQTMRKCSPTFSRRSTSTAQILEESPEPSTSENGRTDSDSTSPFRRPYNEDASNGYRRVTRGGGAGGTIDDVRKLDGAARRIAQRQQKDPRGAKGGNSGGSSGLGSRGGASGASPGGRSGDPDADTVEDKMRSNKEAAIMRISRRNGGTMPPTAKRGQGEGDGEDGEAGGGGRGRRDHRQERRKTKHPSVAGQVSFDQAMSGDPHVGIIGGGLSGLVCALTLAERGIRSTVFDTGKHGLGGRMATRQVSVGADPPLVFDHAAQFFSVSDPVFQSMVDRWQDLGVVQEWRGRVGTLRAGGNFEELPEEKRYIGTGGMRMLCDALATQSPLLTVRRPVWISQLHANSHRWGLLESGTHEGNFDAVVIAHNGKCANRLLAPAGVPSVATQMKENIPAVRAERVKAEMLRGVEEALGVTPGDLPPPIYHKVQLWGAALPLNAPGVACIFDAVGRVGVCGDWLLRPSVEGAALSGRAMANQIADFRDSGGSDTGFSVGLNTEFTKVEAHDIGMFSGVQEGGGLQTSPRSDQVLAPVT